MTERRIYVTEIDMQRLERLMELTSGDHVERLEAELDLAQVVSSTDIPDNVVTMNSRVVFEDVETGHQSTVTLVYPRDADASADRISVLAPVGSALLGLSVGQEIRWSLPGGRERSLRIIEVLYQPEAAGDLHL